MPSTIDIEVYPIAGPSINKDEVEYWLSDIGVKDIIEQTASDGEHLIGLAAKRCYMSFEVGLNPNITKIRRDWYVYLTNILASGHGSVLEHAAYTFAIEGVSRVFTGEMNRHRAGVSISEGSLRYIKLNDLRYWLPTSIATPEKGDEHAAKHTERVFHEVFDFIEERIRYLNVIWGIEETKPCPECTKWPPGSPGYEDMCDKCLGMKVVPVVPFHKKKKITSMLRRLIPMGVATGGIWTLNLRALRHIVALRTHPSAEEEIAMVVAKIGRYMTRECPILFDDFTEDKGVFKPLYHKV